MKLLLLTGVLGLAQGANIAEELTSAGATALVDFVVAAGLADTLAGEGPFTVFAPTNEAFAKLPAELVEMLTADTELLKQVLLSHVVPGALMSGDISDDMITESAGGGQLRANIYLKSDFYDGFVTINGKRVKKADIKADNGVIHMMTDVIYPIPPTKTIAQIVSSDPRFSTLLAAASVADLVETLGADGSFTVFAPTNAAFDKVPSSTLTGLLTDKEALTGLLLRHVLPRTVFQKGITWSSHLTAGGDEIATQVFRNNVVKVVSYSEETGRAGARVEEYDIIATNGVIHVINSVI